MVDMLNLLIWNCRGAANKGVASVIRDMWSRYKLSLVIILEPRISGAQASKTIRQWGFKHSIRKEAVAFSGGIWLLWELDDLKVDVLELDEQVIHCNLRVGEDECLFSAVYASLSEHRRHDLWNLLSRLAGDIVVTWMLAGDFNDIKTPLEQVGGGRVNETRCKHFNNWIQDCNLIDVGAKGPFYTWKGPKWDGLERVYKRLDRCLCNVLWQEKFDKAEIQVVPRLCLDHHPLLVNLYGMEEGRRGRHFRYEAAWQMHEEFEQILTNSWKGEDEAHVKLTELQKTLTRWNKEVFGKIEGRKRRLLNRLHGIQRSVERRINPFLVNLEIKLEEELLHTLRQEEVLWFQKSRGRWLEEGDRNTRYYHMKTLCRRRRNKISMLKRDDGTWADEEVEISATFQRFYHKLFEEDRGVSMWTLTKQRWGMVNEAKLRNVGRDPNGDEIRRVFFQMGGFKAPGSDGYPAVFYQQNWRVVGRSMI
ncbi:hypothetical protein QN277_026692 [Acacia crassicarpa]|uniref:Endonuclease/exonuclease/phosphatase domain-containing protein n=1 Tax=Acacia crassicarpa TaxID=499986 RepID=A0AAE1J8I2_9FABA|nr:hypothetical protein QN277_026692 [Acacia crassicarpa]